METSSLLDTEFKTLIIRMISEIRENSIKKGIETTKKNQSEMKATLTKIKNNLQGINNRINEADNQISDLEFKEAKNTQSESQEKKIQNIEGSVRR